MKDQTWCLDLSIELVDGADTGAATERIMRAVFADPDVDLLMGDSYHRGDRTVLLRTPAVSRHEYSLDTPLDTTAHSVVPRSPA